MRLFNKEGLKVSILIALSLLFLALLLLFVVNVKKESSSPAKKTPPSPAITIAITASGFVPPAVTVHKGTTITWTNDDSAPHQVAANPHPTGTSLPSLRSEILNNKQSYSFTATKAGSFGYHDQLNPGVNGTMEVKDSKAEVKEE